MKPVSRKVMPTPKFLTGNYYQNLGKSNTVASIKGSAKKLGAKYQNALVVLYDKSNLLPILAKKPDINGDYQFLGLNRDMVCFINAFDKNGQLNMVAQDSVVPK